MDQRMLSSLRDAFNKRIPGGLTQNADKRLQRSLEHFTNEIKRVHGFIEEQTVLRETYDSMTKWYRQHTTEIAPVKPIPQQIDPLKQLQRITDADTKSIFAPAMTGDSMVGSGGNSMAAFGSTAFDMMAGGAGRVLDTIDTAKMDYNSTDNPLALYERIKAMRDTAVVVPKTPSEMPVPPELLAVETRPTMDRGPVQPKDFITPQEDVVKYRETEYNLVLNSRDRNWLLNTKENRYNFSIQLDSARWNQGDGPQATIMTRFRNIVRVEFIKALLPVEGLDVVMLKDCVTGFNDPTAAFYSAMALPYVNVILDEVEGNTVATNNVSDRSLAICQYDATWRTDQFNSGKTTNRGYTLFFPKFMKAQRVYAPAPLANFQKLGFQILGPEGLPLSKAPDAHLIENVTLGYDVSGSCYGDISGSYVFIKTKEWFPVWAYSQMDKVEFRGLTFSSVPPGPPGSNALIEWLQRDGGHIVVGIAHLIADLPSYDEIEDGANSAGYANYIIIRNRFTNPEISGIEVLDYFSGSSTGDAAMSYETRIYPDQTGGILNLSRQVQLVLRVVTRDMDYATNTRPDNV
jgi:hypothetical protein